MKRWVRTVLVVGCLLIAAWGTVAVKAFRFPTTDPPQQTDGYYVLASGGGITVVNSGFEGIPVDRPVLLSVPEEYLTIPAYHEVCARPRRDVTCVSPEPVTTQGEARNLGRVAAERGWKSVTVLTHTSHITRTRMLMERCYGGEVRMTAVPTKTSGDAWVRNLFYESGAMVKAAWLSGC